MRKVAPTPSFDSTKMLPSCFLMIAYEVERTRPFPFCFVVKYGSKIFRRFSPLADLRLVDVHIPKIRRQDDVAPHIRTRQSQPDGIPDQLTDGTRPLHRCAPFREGQELLRHIT